MLLQMADAMFPEGQGAPRAIAKDGAAATKSNELLVNAKEAVDGLWMARGYKKMKSLSCYREAAIDVKRAHKLGLVVGVCVVHEGGPRRVAEARAHLLGEAQRGGAD